MMETAAKGSVLAAVILGWAGPSAAEGQWVKLTGPEIEAALDERSLTYENATQTFYKSGRTLYDNGRPSWGYWRIQGDAYCSEWPPNAGWDCYGFERWVDQPSGQIKVRFISQTGHIIEAQYAE